MMITKQAVAMKIASYLRHDISLADLVSWAEDALMEGDFAEDEASTIPDVVARLGVVWPTCALSVWRGRTPSNYCGNLVTSPALISWRLDRRGLFKKFKPFKSFKSTETFAPPRL